MGLGLQVFPTTSLCRLITLCGNVFLFQAQRMLLFSFFEACGPMALGQPTVTLVLQGEGTGSFYCCTVGMHVGELLCVRCHRDLLAMGDHYWD